MFFIEKTDDFDKWLRKLKDLKAKAKILFRLQKLEFDEHFGDCKPIGNGIHELRINYAKGYRVYFTMKDKKIVLLLVGGDKSTQERDIKKAHEINRKIN
jgi:putative addiction module killer protein